MAAITRPITTEDARHLLRILVGADAYAAAAMLDDVQSGCTLTFAGLELTADDDEQTYLLTAPENRPGERANMRPSGRAARTAPRDRRERVKGSRKHCGTHAEYRSDCYRCNVEGTF